MLEHVAQLVSGDIPDAERTLLRMTGDDLAIEIIEFDKVRILQYELSKYPSSLALSSFTSKQRTDRYRSTLHLPSLELFDKCDYEYGVIGTIVEDATDLLRVVLVKNHSSLLKAIVTIALTKGIDADDEVLYAHNLDQLKQVLMVRLEVILEKLFKLT